MSDTILQMRGISKEFPGVKALEHVDLVVERGEVHALVGENGAGKSTLMKVLSGVYPHGSYGGDILVDGQVRQFRGIKDSEAAGIVIIHQELALVPQLSIAENIFLGNEQARSGIIDWGRTARMARELLDRVGLREDPNTPVSALGVGQQQLVEIAKALSKNVRLLILDEPTSALNERDSDNLLRLLGELQHQGITSIMISHKLNEITRVADTITVLRDGRSVETLAGARAAGTATGPDSAATAGAAATDGAEGTQTAIEEQIIRGMVGRDLDQRFPDHEPEIGDVLLEVRDWNVDHPTQPDRRMVDGVSITVRRGEIVGIAGLMGAGRTEFAMSLFGRCYGRYVSGTVHKEGREVALRDVSAAIAHGIAYVPEDRKQLGLILDNDIRRNVTMAGLDRISERGVIDPGAETVRAEEVRRRMRVKSRDIDQTTDSLSGGNQQKVVLGKWMFTEPDVLILDEPTRGIDVGAKYEIYQIIHALADQGRGVLLISSELPELLGMADRIYAMSAGRITGEVSREDAEQETLMRLMTMDRRAAA